MSIWLKPRIYRAAPAVIAHRGAPDLATENSARSFELAMSDGAEILETDVHLTADGHIVCFHDEDFLRLCGRPERIGAVSLWEARQILPDILEFDDFLALTGNIPVIVDVKLAKRVEIDQFVAAVSNHDALERSLFSAYTPAIAAMIRGRSSNANIGLFFPDGGDDIETAHGVNAQWLRVLPKDYEPGVLANIHAAGLSTIAVAAPLSSFGTSTDQPALDRLAEMGIDAVITDNPKLALDVFKGFQ